MYERNSKIIQRWEFDLIGDFIIYSYISETQKCFEDDLEFNVRINNKISYHIKFSSLNNFRVSLIEFQVI